MRVLVLGQGPLPGQENLRMDAPGLRSWHFGLALLQAGHDVTMVVLDESQSAPVTQSIQPGLICYQIASSVLTKGDFLTRLCHEFNPDAAVGVSIFPAYLAALYLPPDLPLWADLFGSPLAEGQAKAFVHNDDNLLEPYARYEWVVARRADIFSTVSSYQKYAWVGALATHGRFNKYSYGHDFVSVIPASVSDEILPHTDKVLRGSLVTEADFVVLWSGGYNTWTDVDTLFQGLEEAMAARLELHFVSTGGSLPSHDEVTYAHFCQLVAHSPHQARYHLLGWLSLATLHNYYYEADVGIILDRWSYEGLLGSRTRLLDWLKYGLPAITTVTAELTEILVQEALCFSFPHGDSQALAALIVELAQNRPILKQSGEKASAWVLENYNYQKVCQPLLAWCAAPSRAPDAGHFLDFAEAGENNAVQRQLAALTSQLDQKNAHLMQLETWAHTMEARLKKIESGGYVAKGRRVLAKVFKPHKS